MISVWLYARVVSDHSHTTEVLVLNISTVVTLRGRNTEPIVKEVLYVNSNSELTSSSERGVLYVSTGPPSCTSEGPSLEYKESVIVL